VLIAGIPDPVSRVTPDFNSFKNSSADYRILLSHRPGIALEASENTIDLTLSGHTHAGQFFPWTIVVKFVHKISKGLHQVGRMWIYVNPGTGSWGPLIRLGTSPEITLLTLTQSNNNERPSERL
jgi:predicted MPP superfamily phosphohydrolase